MITERAWRRPQVSRPGRLGTQRARRRPGGAFVLSAIENGNEWNLNSNERDNNNNPNSSARIKAKAEVEDQKKMSLAGWSGIEESRLSSSASSAGNFASDKTNRWRPTFGVQFERSSQFEVSEQLSYSNVDKRANSAFLNTISLLVPNVRVALPVAAGSNNIISPPAATSRLGPARRRRKFPLNSLSSHPFALNLLIFVLIVLAQKSSVGECVDCFLCQSRNGSNPACEDPFHNLHTVRITTPLLPEHKPNVSYHTPCYTARKNRDGLFPASACLKLSGKFMNGETIIVRHCGLDSGTLTQDTEIGCVMACAEDACNSLPVLTKPTKLLLIPLVSVLTSLMLLMTLGKSPSHAQ